VINAHSSQFLVARGQLSRGPLLLDVDQSRHARDVRRVRVGEQVNLTDGFGQLGTARVVEIPRRGSVLLEVKETWQVGPPVPEITVVQALVKGEKLDTTIAMLTELGVARFTPWLSERAMMRSPKVTERWNKIVREATKQCGRAWLPEVLAPMTTSEVIGSLASLDQILVGDLGASESLGQVRIETAGTVAIVVGPEGGLTPVERAQFESIGAHLVSIGNHTLRSITAGVALTAGLLAGIHAEAVTVQR
jgi:16S rRNA (uracil1498-N3)-methyltransferase